MLNEIWTKIRKWFSKRDNRLSTAAVLLAGCIVWFAAAQLSSGSYKNVDFAVLRETLQAHGDENELLKVFGLDAAEFDGWLLNTSDSVMDVTELLIVRSSDAEVMDNAETKVNARLLSQITAFENYGTDQSFYLKNAIVRRDGNYLFYAVGEENGAQLNAFLNCVR